VAVQKRPAKAESSRNVVAEARAGRATTTRSSHTAWEHIKSFVVALVIFLLIRAFLIEAYRIPSPSMVPALLVGDWLFVNKLVYGPHVPFTNFSFPGYAEPRRNDVAVFESPPQLDEAALGNDPTPTLVKRVVGVPGDTLYMRDDVLYVNGERENRDWIIAGASAGFGDFTSEAFDWQREFTITGSRFGPPPAQLTLVNWGPLVVPTGRFFMLGDNRHNSKDGRYWGLVPRENFRGRPLFVYYSYNADGSDRAWPFLTDIRWSRIGHRIK
jgi:signal peptidase I